MTTRRFLVLAASLLTIGGALACSPTGESPLPGLGSGPALALDGVRLLDPVSGPSGPSTVIVQGDRILAVVDGDVALPERVARIDAGGRYLIPGLWDLHTHLAMADPAAPPLLVTQGVTGARDLGGELEAIDALSVRIESGELLGPRILRAGPTLNGAPNGDHHRVIESAAAAYAAVAELAGAVDFFKTHNATGREAYFALLEAADAAGMDVVGHVPTAVDVLEACAAGQASVEHIATIFEGTYLASFDSERQAFESMPAWLESEGPAVARCFAEHDTLFVPTLRAYDMRTHRAAAWDDPDPNWRFLSADGYRQWRASGQPSEIDRRPEIIAGRQLLVEVGQGLVERMHQAGAPIGTGTDLAPGFLPGFDVHAEIRLLADAGLSPRDALRAATRGPGSRSGGDPLAGRIVAGAPADLVLLAGDAFEDLGALERIEGVLLRGRWLDRAELDRVLSELEAAGPEL